MLILYRTILYPKNIEIWILLLPYGRRCSEMNEAEQHLYIFQQGKPYLLLKASSIGKTISLINLVIIFRPRYF